MSNQSFFTMLRNAHLYAPEDQGVQDLLIAGEKIAGIGKISSRQKASTAVRLTSRVPAYCQASSTVMSI